MEPASTKLKAVLEEMLPRMSRPRCKVYMNCDSRPVDWSTDTKTIADQLAAQLTSPVQWKKCVENMIADGVEDFYECGPLKQLKAMMKRIDNNACNRTQNIEV